MAQGWERDATASQEPASVWRGCSEQELMSLDKHKMILRGCVFPHHTVWGVWFCRQYKYTCTELTQLQQLINMGGHSTALIWLYYLPELTLYAAEMYLHDAKPELKHPAGCGQLPTKLGKVSFPPPRDSSYKQDKPPRNNCEPAEL